MTLDELTDKCLSGQGSEEERKTMSITDNDQANVLFVEYDSDGHPFGVITAGESGHHKLHWNFAWSKAFGYSLYHLSGCGGERRACISDWVGSGGGHRFWAASDLLLVRYVRCGTGGRYVVCDMKAWARMGNVRRAKPSTDDPFADAVESEAFYCRTCRDWFPEEEWNFCEHLACCDTCRQVVHVTKSGHVGWDDYHSRRKRHSLRD